MDSEVINVVIAVAVIYFVVKWFSGGSSESSNTSGLAKILGFKPKNVTPEMIDSVRAVFPDIPRANIHYDLLRTGSVEATVHRLMERGYLDAPPPAYRRAFPQTDSDNAPVSASTNPANKPTPAKVPTLIQRFRLETKIASDAPTSDEPEGWNGTGPIPYAAKGKGRATEGPTGPTVWEATAEKRQESLQKRKEAMILAARRKLMEKDAKASATQ
ncbi:hypothetical protein CPB86DRAFT_809029 [Serendipita vermifera]|nr:hypothetical protein CPB86DRAFT_809029 [Serendipita vermifera]